MSACETRGLKILATRRYPGPAWDELSDVEVIPLADVSAPRSGVEALIVANEPVPLELLPELRIVANFGVGYDRIDVAALVAAGVTVTNTPGVLDAATADLTFALILAVRRRIVEGDRLARSGRWRGSYADAFLGQEVTGSTLGIVGLGRTAPVTLVDLVQLFACLVGIAGHQVGLGQF